MNAKLVLEDGSSFEGIFIGAPGEKIGEVILNTAVVGYQEMLTDPANAGKILVLTYPLIGNYGIAEKFNESNKCWVEGLIIKENSRIFSNWQAEDSFENFLNKEKTVAIEGIDTRTLAVHIRDNGEMFGIISTQETDNAKLLNKLRENIKNIKKDFIKKISVRDITKIKIDNGKFDIAILDLGVTNGLIKQLKTLGCNITLLPYNITADEILKSGFDALVISNGPEDDNATTGVAETIKAMLGKIPILGISTGHEIIALALGAQLKKMAMGHRGVNYPVKSPDSFKGEITVQNHLFIVDEESIKNRKDARPVRNSFLNGVNITLRNVNDNSIEEMESKSLKFISTQYYPVSPGFDEVNPVFLRFIKIIK